MQVISKAEIDTTAPFRSVKEAVLLFGERVLGAEVYGAKLREMQNGNMLVEHDDIETETSSELEEAKQRLQEAREESIQMATSLFFLQQELEEAKTELQQLKINESCRIETKMPEMESQKKKYVTFADPPCIEQVVSSVDPPELGFRRQPSLKKKKMKRLIPLIKRIFFRKRENSGVTFA